MEHRAALLSFLGRVLFDGSQGQQRRALAIGDAGQSHDVQALVPTLRPKGAQASSTLTVPELHRSVEACASENLTVSRQRQVANHAGMTLRRCHGTSGAYLPQPDSSVRTAACDQPTVGGQRY